MLGATLFHQFGISTWGRDEDTADAIATYILTRVGLHDVAFSGAQSFAFMAMNRQQGEQLKVWDQHSLDEQRFFNITCWLYGSAPAPYAFLVRAKGCPAEFARLDQDASRDLGPHLRAPAVSGSTGP